MANLTYDQITRLDMRGSLKEFANSLGKTAAAKLPVRIFLSYSHQDEDKLPGVIEFFANHGAGVYVDKGDDRLPNPPSPITANMLRRHISLSPRTVMLLSPKSYQSHWIPWELGLADGHCGSKKTAILPISQDLNDTFWRTREYLGLYPIISKPESSETWNVNDPEDGKYWGLTNWIHKPE